MIARISQLALILKYKPNLCSFYQIDTKGSEKVLGDQFGASVNAFGYPESQLR